MDYLSFFGVFGVPGSNQVTIKCLYKYYSSLFDTFRKASIQSLESTCNDEYDTVYGYCCRQLFNTFIQNMKNDIHYKNRTMNIGVSPIHHTSFRDILERNFAKENIHIFDIDENYEKITIPEEKKDIDYDIVVITHLWGKYLDISDIKRNINGAILVEDVILAGEYEHEFSNKADLIFHSCGMDKRPSSLFGGYVHIKKSDDNRFNIKEYMLQSIQELSIPTKKEVFQKTFDNTILYLLYNVRCIQNMVKLFINIIGYRLSYIIQKIRKNKPGFEHSNFMRQPTKLMIDVNKSIYNTQQNTEKLFIRKNKLFLSQFSDKEIRSFFPWNRDFIETNEHVSCLPYNIVYIDENNHNVYVDYFDKHNICIINNPTYKTFKHAKLTVKTLLNNIFYLPCVYNLTKQEIVTLSEYLKKTNNITI